MRSVDLQTILMDRIFKNNRAGPLIYLANFKYIFLFHVVY